MKSFAKFSAFILSAFLLFSSCSSDSDSSDYSYNPPQEEPVMFTVIYETKSGWTTGGYRRKYKENTVLSESDLQEPHYYDSRLIFKGWYDGDELVVAGKYTVTKNVTLTAHWSNSANIRYSFPFFDHDTDIYEKRPKELYVEENSEFTEENLPSIDCSPYTFLGWFYSPYEYKNYESEPDDIYGNGTGTQVKVGDKITEDTVIYARFQTSKICFDYGDSKYTTQKYTGSAIEYLPCPEKTGYKLLGWYDGDTKIEEGYVVTGDVTFTTKWSNEKREYKVYHYLENANDSGYTLTDTETLTGFYGDMTDAVAKDYEHFIAGNIEQKEIGDTWYDTDVKIYYNREKVTFTIDPNNIYGSNGPRLYYSYTYYSEPFSMVGKYGQTNNQKIEPDGRGKYSFEGWNTIGGTLPEIFECDATYKAIWSSSKISVTVSEEDISVNQSTSGSIITFTAETCDSYRWTLDDSEIGTSRVCTIDTSTLVKGGVYTLVLEAKKDGRWYSYFAQVKVE